MRQIGTLPSTFDPSVFGDYLLSVGIGSKCIQSKDGWAIWVLDEDQLSRARTELESYRTEPDASRYRDASRTAAEVRREAERLDRLYVKNYKNLSGTWDRLNVRRRPLTMFLVFVCVGVYLAQELLPGVGEWTLDKLAFFSFAAMTRPHNLLSGLDDIQHGQLWRLITPIFLHGGIVHLIFNMWAMVVEGTLIENHKGTRFLLLIVFVSAVTSNIGQFIYVLNFYSVLIPWVGISGVGYALFGYLWMKGRYQPEEGMILHPQSVRLMLLWLLLGFTGLFPMANGAHVAGLIIGMLFGLARF